MKLHLEQPPQNELCTDEQAMVDAAIKFLEADLPWSDFHTSVKQQYQERGSITVRQAQSLVKMENKLIARGHYKRGAPQNKHGYQQRRGQENLGTKMTVVAGWLAEAATHKRYPRIVFRVGGTDFHMYPAGSTSKYQGWIQIKVGAENKWIGRVNPETGELHGHYGPGVLAALKQFGEDPMGAVKAFATLTENCCFCATPLTHPVSTSHGYGPICAAKHGLPWDKVTYDRYNREQQDD
jgi:hypothetical protein